MGPEYYGATFTDHITTGVDDHGGVLPITSEEGRSGLKFEWFFTLIRFSSQNTKNTFSLWPHKSIQEWIRNAGICFGIVFSISLRIVWYSHLRILEKNSLQKEKYNSSSPIGRGLPRWGGSASFPVPCAGVSATAQHRPCGLLLQGSPGRLTPVPQPPGCCLGRQLHPAHQTGTEDHGGL